MQHFTTFKRYTSATQALETQKLLETNGIESRLADNNASVDSNFGKEAFIDFEVQLYPVDFERAEALLEEQAAQFIDDLPQDYYLFTFTDEELYEVIYKKDEWSELDYVLAKKILAGRGRTIDESEIEWLETERFAKLEKPEEVGSTWIIIGYIAALMGGFFGILTGYMVYYSKKTLPNGKRVFTYNESNRENAKVILLLGILVLIMTISWRIFKLV